MTDDMTDDTEIADEPVRKSREKSKAGLIIASGAAALAFVAAVVFGVLWWTKTSSSEHDLAATRHSVLEAARKGVVAYTAFDHTKPDDYRKAQQEASTKELNDVIKQGWEKARANIVKNQLSARVSVIDLGIAELDAHKGSAQVLAAIKVNRTAKGEQVHSPMMRLITQLERVGDEWKVADLAAASASAGAETE